LIFDEEELVKLTEIEMWGLPRGPSAGSVLLPDGERGCGTIARALGGMRG
jgi:hypothetical protein